MPQEFPPNPSLDLIRKARKSLGTEVMRTPVIEWTGEIKDQLLSRDTSVFLKLELFQPGGSFKLRGALLNIRKLTVEELKRGVTAVSAGNHAIAVAMAARVAGTHAKVVMPRSANPGRIRKCERLGAEVVLVTHVAEAFEKTEQIQEQEGRTFLHPFDGEITALGTATVGLEMAEQMEQLDAAIIPVGGGGLAAGVSAALSQSLPGIELFGVEPTGADTMSRSFASGRPEKIDAVNTIADSLGAPFTMPYSMGLCRRNLHQMVRISDEEMVSSMRLMFDEFKLASEPAGASSLAALLGPLKEKLLGKRVGCIVCGSNIDSGTFFSLIANA